MDSYAYIYDTHILISIDIYLPSYLHMYLPTYSCMSSFINKDAYAYIHNYMKHASLHSYTYSNIIKLA